MARGCELGRIGVPEEDPTVGRLTQVPERVWQVDGPAMIRQQHVIRCDEKFFDASGGISPTPQIEVNPAKALARGEPVVV